MKTQKNGNIVALIASVIAAICYFFKYIHFPMVNQLLSEFTDDALNFDVESLFSLGRAIFSVMKSEEMAPPANVILVFVIFFILPMLLLFVNAIINVVALATDKVSKGSGIFSTVSGVVVFLITAAFGICVKYANSQIMEEFGDFGMLLSSAIKVGFGWWIQLIAAAAIAGVGIYIIVNSSPKSTETTLTPNSVAVIGMSGACNGQVFTLFNEETETIGRDVNQCNIIVDEGAEKVSRKHCSVRYDFDRQKYMVTDFSSNGTYVLEGGQKKKLQYGSETAVPAGYVLLLGNESTAFKLN